MSDNLLDQNLLDEVYAQFVEEALDGTAFLVLEMIVSGRQSSQFWLVSRCIQERLERFVEENPVSDRVVSIQESLVEKILRTIRVQITADGEISVENKEPELTIILEEERYEDASFGFVCSRNLRVISVETNLYVQEKVACSKEVIEAKKEEEILSQDQIQDLVFSLLEAEPQEKDPEIVNSHSFLTSVKKERTEYIYEELYVESLKEEISFLKQKIGYFQHLLEVKEKRCEELIEKIEKLSYRG